MTAEQYGKLKELQRLKTTDEQGRAIEEAKEEEETDTDDLVTRRIRKIVSANGIPVLLKLIAHSSNQTKEAAGRALRQICTDDGSGARGLVIQHGGLKVCATVTMEADMPRAVVLECAHIIAKTLITTNPHLLTEHLRLSCIPPLITLCRDTEATNLQLFEALLALTNITSCGEVEQNRLAQDKGVAAVHYLIFSEHTMVRRAATEALCNMGGHESVLRFLRAPESLRLWLGLSEEYDKEVRGLEVEEEGEGELETIEEEEEEVEEVVSEGVLRLGSVERTPTSEPTSKASTDQKQTRRKQLSDPLYIQSLTVQSEPYKTARAALGTLAGAVGDEQVVAALHAEGCASTFVMMLKRYACIYTIL